MMYYSEQINWLQTQAEIKYFRENIFRMETEISLWVR